MDLTPLFRSTVGFDHLTRLLDGVSRVDDQTLGYPPYNIEKLSEDDYRVTMAVAGFAESDIDITVQGNSLTVSGKVQKEEARGTYLHRGIAGRSFERRFQLADHIKVKSAALVNGMLYVELSRVVPEALKPRSIAIGSTLPEQPKAIEATAAAA